MSSLVSSNFSASGKAFANCASVTCFVSSLRSLSLSLLANKTTPLAVKTAVTSAVFILEPLRYDSKPLDYIRRKISQSLKKELGYTPLYLFGIHNEDNGNIHIHGMIKIENNQKAVTKILKIAACGRKYKTMSINKNILRITNLNCAYGWLKYIFKCKQYDDHIYVCRKLIQENQKFYERMKRRLLRIKKNFI